MIGRDVKIKKRLPLLHITHIKHSPVVFRRKYYPNGMGKNCCH